LNAFRALRGLKNTMQHADRSHASVRRFALGLAVVVTLLGAAGQPSGAQTTATGLNGVLAADLDAYLKSRGAAEHLPSLSLTVSFSRSRLPLNVTRGTTKFHAGVPVTPMSLYQIGSNTKAFTAVAVLQLEAQHRLSIDAPIGMYLPQYPAYRNLTLRQLLSMTGGIESYDNTSQWEHSYAKHPKADVSADALIRLVYPRIKFPAGSRYSYSNTGYLLAQQVVAARSPSKSFEREVERIIASVHLKNTFYTSHLYPAAVARRVVSGYYENNDKGLARFLGTDMSGDSLSWAQGAGSIVSTPADLVTWARAMYEGTKLLPRRQHAELVRLISVKTAKTLPVPTANDPAGFGLGVAARFDPKLGAFWLYLGETLGFRAAHVYFPGTGIVLALFANSRPIESESHLQTLVARLYAHVKAANR
jgi:D-alanyl-D-alanine carboxypeptidase